MNNLNVGLLRAVADEDLEAVQKFVLAGADVNYISPREDTPLLVAIDAMNLELVRYLLDQGANPNPDPQRVYALPLHVAIDVAVQAVLNEEAETVSNETVALLVQYGADYTIPDKSGKNALEMAVNYNSTAREFLESIT